MTKTNGHLFKIAFILFTWFCVSGLAAQALHWSFFVRTSGHPLTSQNIDAIVQSAQETHLFGIEVDNDITGRYDSFLNPTAKLNDLRKLVQKVHAAQNYVFVYVAGLECITPQAAQRTHTFFKDHPNWVQRDRQGRPAVFSANDAFWIKEGDEDVWISPYAQPWRKIYMQRIRQIAETGVDGIYVDIPYWMTHFEGWENTWASFDSFTTAAFKKQSGLNAVTDLKLGDFNDPNFRKWVDFRLQTIRDFLAEIDHNVKQVNPSCLTIAEIYPGLDFEAVRVGADVSLLYQVVDVITHEFSTGAYMASERQVLDWHKYITSMLTFRSLAGNKPSWMLSYSWDGNPNVKPAEAMRLLFLTQLFAGTNSWDAGTFHMSGSNDYRARKQIFHWIAKYQQHFYGPKKPVGNVGLYFSAATRNYYAQPFIKSFTGLALMALHAHIPLRIVTEQNLAQFDGKILLLPDVRRLTPYEAQALRALQQKNIKLVLTQNAQTQIIDSLLLNVLTALHRQSPCPGKQYLTMIEKAFNPYALNASTHPPFLAFAHATMQKILNGTPPLVQIQGPATVLFNVGQLNGKLHLNLINFSGLQGGRNLIPKPLPKINIKLHRSLLRTNRLTLLPYLQTPQVLTAQINGDYYEFTINNFSDGVFLWEN